MAIAGTPQKIRRINLQKFPSHEFYNFKGTSSVRNTNYHSPGQEMKKQSTINTQRKACQNASNPA